MIVLVLYVSFAIGISFLCSLLESSLLSARSGLLVERARGGSRGAARLLALKRSRIDDALSAILILNTLANTLGATMAGAEAARVFGSAWVGVFSGALTFMILVVAEIIPKTLGAIYAISLAPFVGWALSILTTAMAPVLVLSRSLTRLLTRGQRVGLSRGELSVMIEAAVRDGAISPEESTIFENLLRLQDVRVEDVMTPHTVVFRMAEDATVDDLLRKPESETFSRIPLFRESPDDVVGYVLVRDVLRDITRGGDRSQPLSRFVRRMWFVPERISLDTGMRQILERREPIAMVTDEHGGIAGLVTLEDITETILGVEIVDESDRVVDLRLAAAELRDRRMARMRRKRELASGPESTPSAS